MTKPRRPERDPLWLAVVRARLARMKVARAAREIEEIQRSWGEQRRNVIEAAYLRRVDARRDRDDA